MLWEKGPCVNQGGLSGVSSSQLSASGQSSPGPQPWEAVSVLRLTLSFLLLAGEQTKALVTQLTLFNRVLSELREDIRDQVGLGGLLVLPGLDFPRAQCQHPPDAPCSAALQVKEMSLIRNTIMECQVCGECWQRLCSRLGGQRATLSQPSPASPLLSSGFHEQRSRCNPNPCFSGVDCMETYEYPGYRCGPCPPGLEGNGTHCVDIEEVGMVLGDQQPRQCQGCACRGCFFSGRPL